jgi:hypothetical protein
VIAEKNDLNKEEEEKKIEEEGIWNLHENLFKRSANHQVNPENLRKTSS